MLSQVHMVLNRINMAIATLVNLSMLTIYMQCPFYKYNETIIVIKQKGVLATADLTKGGNIHVYHTAIIIIIMTIMMMMMIIVAGEL